MLDLRRDVAPFTLRGESDSAVDPVCALEDVAGQVRRRAEVGQALVDESAVDGDVWPSSFAASKLTSSSRRSITVERRRAPMFSVRRSFVGDLPQARDAVRRKASVPRLRSAARLVLLYQRRMLCVRIASNPARERLQFHPIAGALRSGIGSLGLDQWKAPLAMNRMWSVLMAVLGCDRGALHHGSKSRCTPGATLPRPWHRRRGGDLVDLIDEDDAVLLGMADGVRISSSFTRPAASSSTSSFSLRRSSACAACGGPGHLADSRAAARHLLHAGRRHDLLDGLGSARSISMSLSESDPSRTSCAEHLPPVLSVATSSPRPSHERLQDALFPASSARARTLRISATRVCFTAISPGRG